MPPPKEQGICKCGWCERAADDPQTPIEFDAELNEYHIVKGPKNFLMMYYCPFCGGETPKSKREGLFHKLTDAERMRLVNLTKEMRTMEDVTRAFGEPDLKLQVGTVITEPERDGNPEKTQNFPMMVYTKLSETADMHVTLYPAGEVAITFQGKAKKNAK